MFTIKKATLQEIAEAVYKKVNTRPSTTEEIVAMLLQEDVTELGADDFALGTLTEGKLTSETEMRMFTDALEIPKQGSVSVQCKSESPFRWLCYWFVQSNVPAFDCIGKTLFSRENVEDIMSLSPASGTKEGATHFRISIEDGTSTEPLTGRKEEVVSKCKVTIRKYLGGYS